MYRWFIAYKHILSRLVTFAAVMAVTLSVAVLIIVVSVMEGFRSEIQNRIRGTTSDVRLTGTRYIGLKNPKNVAKLVEAVEGVDHVTPIVESLVLYRSERWPTRQEAEDRSFLAFNLDNVHSVAELNQYLVGVKQPPAPIALNDDETRRTEDLFASLPKDVRTYFSKEWLEEGLWETRRKLFGGSAYKPLIQLPAVLAGVESFRREFLLPGDVIKLTSISPGLFQKLAWLSLGSPIPDRRG